ncbi:TonB-dependent receptor [Novosphingobium colocasiae]|uniref:TonB-dependent receptor n=2 Tax=Novosphingobium colocasiae TaxID=1256513 RepID=A0A918UF72_9SPHN|nr:TonB-dependent receptor [Novosphingobium colocasiae]
MTYRNRVPARARPACAWSTGKWFRTASQTSAALAALAGAVPAMAQDIPAEGEREGVIIVTARQRVEDAQKVPVALSVVDGTTLDRTATISTSTLSQLVPTLNYSSPNPRNTAYTIRGLGSGVAAVSSSNDGLEAGVGYYVDQVYHARPATAAFDFTDVERVEILRGPQGTLFGKNSTAGAISIATRKPQFTPAADGEFSFGEHDALRVRAAVTGPLAGDVLAFRLSGMVNRRDGLVRNITSGHKQNDVDNKATRAQLLFQSGPDFSLRLIADWSSVKGECCVPVPWKVVTTNKAANKQFANLAASLGYTLPTDTVYDRVTDIDSPLNLDTSEGGVSGIADWKLGGVTLISVSAWRFWNWNVDNDRDYTGVEIQTIQRIPSRHDQFSQELRLATNGDGPLQAVGGLYFLDQVIKGTQNSEYGADAAYWLLGSTYPAALLDGYGISAKTRFHARSYAAFGEVTWRPLPRLAVTGGLRYTYEKKHGSYLGETYGGLATTNPTDIKGKKGILQDQDYAQRVSDGSITGRVNFAYDLTDGVMVYAGYAQAEKSGGINMSGLPVDQNFLLDTSKAVVRPEKNKSWEAGIKIRALNDALTLSLDAFRVDVTDYQANVVNNVGTSLRTYLANIPKVRSQGVELDGSWRVSPRFSVRFAGAYTDARYRSYPAGPCPIETVATPSCDLSGVRLANTPRWAGSLGGEYTAPLAAGEAYLRADANARTRVNGDASGSTYLVIPGYALVNASIGYRSGVWDVSVFARNLFDKDYLQNVTAQTGNSGLIFANPGDPRIIGLSVRLRQ